MSTAVVQESKPEKPRELELNLNLSRSTFQYTVLKFAVMPIANTHIDITVSSGLAHVSY